MSLPALSHIPVESPDIPRIRLPGGAILAPIEGISDGDRMKVVRNAIGQLNAAVAPLSPIFSIFDTVIALQECIKAVPSVIGNPKKLFDAIEKLAKAIASLLGMVPQLSVPIMVADFIKLLVFMLIALKFELSALIQQALRMERAAEKAAMKGNEALLAVLQKAQDNYGNTVSNHGKSMMPIDQLISFINALLDIAQVPEDIRLPTIQDLGSDAEEALDIIDIMIEGLQKIAALLPI